SLTAEIDRVVLKAMDKSPNRRPLTMRQFLTEVSGLVAPGAAPSGANANAGFAKTMLVSGGSHGGKKLVPAAVAARAEPAATAPAPAPAPVPAPEPAAAHAAAQAAAQEPPAPIGPRRTHGAAIAATVVSLPAARIPGAGPGMGSPMGQGMGAGI